jgi:eukaryotic-like serine/threonine-protein kinase
MLLQKDHTKICAGYEPIPGYRVQSLLGRGGFGEVWKCEAPGGLQKAIKFVHGAMDQDRAARELKSLNRIKTVQHPFLLTLERFDFVDDRLVIVTELADQSLEEEFVRHQTRGSCGIPRDQLLNHLSDAAEALDHLHQRYGLQHLDVKPGNLLLVGDHAKVADFGLLKDLKDVDCSIVGGLTPVYAPPELFDGRPAMNSDQYSLAVMFQELLTGVRPFSGRTIAQLATQHVHSAPNLNPLLPSDRPIIARALEKNPDRRFGSCREFISALRQAADRSVRSSGNVGSGSVGSASVGGGGIDAVRRNGDTSLGEFSAAARAPVAKVNDLPSLNVGDGVQRGGVTQHALVVSLGGLGAECLAALAEKVNQNSAACPLVLHGILIDTDPGAVRTIDFMQLADDRSKLRTLCVPLKKPQQYRELRSKRFRSISRRWIYNVPRSGSTEGLRPLGRLALLDNSERVESLLLSSVQQLADVKGDHTPSVYVVGTLDGGTASGMVLDVMHLLRDVLDRSGLENAVVRPLLATGSLQPDAQRALAGHNAACALAEMRHLINIANGYPGEEAVGWPCVPAARSPLADAYVVASGQPGDASPSPAETLSAYIWADSTYAGSILAAARLDAQEPALDRMLSPSLRSVGIVYLGNPRTIEESFYAPSVVRRLLTIWTGEDRAADDSTSVISTQLVKRFQMTSSAILEYCLGQWPSECSERVEALDQWLATLEPTVLADPALFNGSLRELAHSTLGSFEQQSQVADVVGLRRDLAARLTDRRLDLHRVLTVTENMIELIKSHQSQLNDRLVSEPVGPERADLSLSREIALLSEQWLWRAVCKNVRQIFTRLLMEVEAIRSDLVEQIQLFRRCVAGLTDRLQEQGLDSWQAATRSWKDRAEEVVRRLHQSAVVPLLAQPVTDHRAKIGSVSRDSVLQYMIGKAVAHLDETAGNSTGLGKQFDTSADSARWSRETRRWSRETRQVAVSATSEISFQPRDWTSIIAAALRAVRPVLLDCGGSQRMLLVVSSEEERAELEPKVKAVHKGPLTSVVIGGADTALICEAQGINLNDLRARIMVATGGREDVLSRLHSRCDIDWS